MEEKLISDEYKALLTQKHDVRPWGGTGKHWVPLLVPIFAAHPEWKTVLDYGCGRGTFKQEMAKQLPHIQVEEYDPGVRGKDVVPLIAYDFVVCTDVLEHIEPECIDHVLAHIERLADRGFFFLVVFTESKSSLPDGRNTHILIRSDEWWKLALSQVFRDFDLTYHEDTPYRAAISGVRR